MQFSPTASDYIVLIVTTFLSLLSGFFSFLAFCSSDLKHEKNLSGRTPVLEVILLVLISSIVVTSFVLLLTAQLGIFRFRYWCQLFVLYLGGILFYLYRSGKLRFGFPRIENRSFAKSDWLVLPLCGLALYTFNRPAQSIHTRDPGGYVNIAVRISETGSLKHKDPDYQGFDSKYRERLFLPVPLSQVRYPQVVPGFHLVDPASGELVPRYFHLFPLWLALFFKLWRFSGMFTLNVFLGMLSVLILVPLSQRLFGSRLIGFLSAALLATNMGQVWIVRSPFSEILAQVLLLAGIWTLSIGMIEKRRGFSALSGLLFGLTLFTRVDSVLILAALIVFSVVAICLRDRITSLSFPLFPFLVPLLAVTAYAAVHTAIFSYPYLETVINTFRNITLPVKHLIIVGCALAVFLLIIWKRVLNAKIDRAEVQRKVEAVLRTAIPSATFGRSPEDRSHLGVTSLALFILLTALLIYAYLIRPLSPGTDTIALPFPLTGNVRFYDEITLVRLGWYLSPLGIFLAYLGSSVSLQRLAKGGSAVLLPFMFILGIFAVFYLYKSRAFPDNYWVIRRYVEIVIPGFLMLASLTLVSLFSAKGRKRNMSWRFTSLAIVAGTFLLLAGWQLRAAYPLLNQTEWENTFFQLENLAGASQEADILLLERGQFQDFFSSPLKFIFHKTIYPLASDRPDVEAFENLMDQWTQQGKRVNLLASEEHTELASRKYRFVPKQRFLFSTRVVEETYERIPQSMEDLRFTVQIYGVEKRLQPEDPTSITLNLGYNFGFKTMGFYNTELSTDYEPFRWSSGSSSIELPALENSHEASLILRLRRDVPESVARIPIEIFFNGNLVAEPRLSSKFEVIKASVSKELLASRAKNEIRFLTATYSPARLGASDDIRELGFMLHSLKLQSLVPIDPGHSYFVDFGTETDSVDGELTGFYNKEPSSYRWTEPAAQVVLPRPLTPGPDLWFSVRALKSCPDPDFKQFLMVSVNGMEIGKKELLDTWDQFRTYDFSIPGNVLALSNTVIQLRVVPPWTPKRTDYYTDDWRPLGCAIDWLKVGQKELGN